jgi:hypothetical protein
MTHVIRNITETHISAYSKDALIGERFKGLKTLL